MSEPKQYWFPAKRIGWGWGTPSTWQGWIVLGLFVAVMIVGGFVFPPNQNLVGFIVYAVVAFVIFGAIFFLKGEPTKWRSGGE